MQGSFLIFMRFKLSIFEKMFRSLNSFHRIRIYFLLCFVIIFQTSAFSAVVDYNSNCKRAYKEVFALRFKEAAKILQAEKLLNPNNVAPIIIENISDCLNLFVSENRNDFDKYKERFDERLEILEKIDPSSPYSLYCKAGLYFQWAVVRIKFGEYYTAALHFRKAYRMFEENSEKFPNFLPNNTYLGLMHAAVGAVPEQYKWLANLAGFKGSLKQGIAELERVSQLKENSEFFYQRDEALMVLAFVYQNLQKNQGEAKRIASKLFQTNPSPITGFLYSNILIHAYENDLAIETMDAIPKGKDQSSIAYLDYLKGVSKLNRLDTDANIYLEKFIRDFKGVHYLKAAYQKLGWYYFVNGDTLKYQSIQRELKTKGNDLVDEDKQAMVEAIAGDLPNLVLLKSRLLFDGGYFQEAFAQFSKTTIQDFPSFKNQLEVTYRIARINHQMKNYPKAIEHYQETLKNGYSHSFYFAANSALQLGLIYEDIGDKSKSEFYFKKCLAMRSHEYQNSIDQKAKTGLERLAK